MSTENRFMTMCRTGKADRPPVWMMRQAGRTLPEYRALREQYSFWDVCRTPSLAAEVTIQPLRRFQLDAAIIFSDILVVPAAMGMSVEIHPHMRLDPPVRSASDVASLRRPDVGKELGYVAGALRETRKFMGPGKALLGFSGAPYTLACYMVEGGGGKSFHRVKAFMHNETAGYETFMALLSDVVGDYLEMQAEAGADAVQLFDTWAGDLAPEDYRRFALPWVRRIAERLARKGVTLIYFVNGAASLLEDAASSGAPVLGLDWRLPLSAAAARLGPGRPILQGNLDPATLFAPPEVVRSRTLDMLDALEGEKHIANLGHGLLPDTPLEGVGAFVDAVASWKPGREA